ncbi:palmitoyl-monogalactosyldiacylglycerol delta-7 desaturase, chloroplastic-like [Argentina anserina]|uniref:palmitoyl-monogalactosyldiacylglycerol delta-7 desaturase, chloroplastic-like n=1 Tax=Argentina anserina TaxID=57926 RepID=UPI002176918A|nr:palmitoyl-monogalactosyldiacylglycerol delta-7 desaturase, chloroplastic-like [Potentilla anserina]
MGLARIWATILMTPCAYFWGRKWNLLDLVTAAMFVSIHILCLFAPFYLSWTGFFLALVLGNTTAMAVTLSYHRNLAHRSFRLPKFLEYFFAYIAVLSGHGSPIEWVSTHRHHHQYTDTEKDAHSPLKGFWFSHMGWILDSNRRFGRYGGLRNVDDLKRQSFYKFLHHTFLLHSFILGVILYAVGGFPFIVWGMGVRMVAVYHGSLAVNSAGHTWGYQAWNTGDLSKNLWWLGVLADGEGWHNNHHAFEYSARLGLEWWQIDTTWYFIKFLEVLGLATEVKQPSEAQKKRKALEAKTTIASHEISYGD